MRIAIVLLAGTAAVFNCAGADAPLNISVRSGGCPSDGQVGPVAAPRTGARRIPVNRELASQLAFYETTERIGVLAPKGWRCFGGYGSGGEWVIVSPVEKNISTAANFGNDGLEGPFVMLTRSDGGTSGRMTVASVIAREFPVFANFVKQVQLMNPESNLRFETGPYPADVLKRRGDRVVEYETPAGAEGLGTSGWRVMPNGRPVRGVAILTGSTPDLVMLRMRLREGADDLAEAILSEVERKPPPIDGTR